MPSGKPPPLEPSAPVPPGLFGGDDMILPEPSERASASGTGFMVADGKLLTNRHVIASCDRVVARDGAGTRLPARVQASDRNRDLALLTLPARAGPPLTFRDAPPVRRGEAVITYGFPLSGLLSSGPSLTTGNVSALAGLRDNPKNFQISAAVQPGNSGGPLFDSRGNVIGVVVSKLNAQRVAEMTGGDIPQKVNFASTGAEKRPDEVDAVANPSTLYLQCFR